MGSEVLLQVRDLSVTYKTRLGVVSAVDHISFDICKSEILGLVGESGCGKSTLGKALLAMIPSTGKITGKILFNGQNVLEFTPERLRDFRGRQMSMIFQDPLTSLNPVQRVDEHLIEAIQVHEHGRKSSNLIERITILLDRLGIQSNRVSSFPHQLSGGMRQRVMVGLGLVLNANLIIADEATTSLDVIVEAKLVDQLRQIRDEFGVALLIITHNIALVAELADRLAVMYAGHIVEIGRIEDVFDHPLHPYTQGLLASVPTTRLDGRQELYKMAGEPPNLTRPPSGCRFHPRCPRAIDICTTQEPPIYEAAANQEVKCWLYKS